MKKYTANYTYTNTNLIIQNLVINPKKSDLLPILFVIKNILQRAFPSTLSKYLQSQIGGIHKLENFEERFLFATEKEIIIQQETFLKKSFQMNLANLHSYNLS